MFRRSASLAIGPFRISKVSPRYRPCPLCHLGTRIAAFSCHTNRSVKLPSFRHFQDQFLYYQQGEVGEENGPVFRNVCVLTFHGQLASHDSNPYPQRSRIARYNATKLASCSTLDHFLANAPTPHRMLQGAAQRGAQFYFILAVLQALHACSKVGVFQRPLTPILLQKFIAIHMGAVSCSNPYPHRSRIARYNATNCRSF